MIVELTSAGPVFQLVIRRHADAATNSDREFETFRRGDFVVEKKDKREQEIGVSLLLKVHQLTVKFFPQGTSDARTYSIDTLSHL